MKVRRLTLTYHLLTSLTAVLCIHLKNKNIIKQNKNLYILHVQANINKTLT